MLEFPFYRGDRDDPVSDGHERLPVFNDPRRTRHDRYIPEEGLRDAVNVALILNQPLLLTGAPGTGKTQLAYHLAWELGFDKPLKFETKSSSTARDLFYVYDALGRYHQDSASTNALDYITFNSLGIAILRGSATEMAARYLAPDQVPERPCRSVVLIDEVDKAPRDFPNDVLNELEGMYFKIPELGNVEIRADQANPPAVVITSNSEKHLPDPFLRRCVYYHIPFPEEKQLRDIVSARIGDVLEGNSDFLDDALEVFFAFRDAGNEIHKKPSTAELLGWMVALRRMAGDGENPLRVLDQSRLLGTIGSLVKTGPDTDEGRRILSAWIGRRGNGGSDTAGE